MTVATSANGNGAASPSGSRAGLMSVHFAGEKTPSKTFTLIGLDGIEGISQLYHYQLHLVADPAKPVDFAQFLGKPVSIQIPLPGGGTRTVNGILSRLTQGRIDRTHAHYQAEVVPRLWLLTRRAQSRIFQEFDATGIIANVLDSVPGGYLYGGPDLGNYPVRPYCVQYRETDFNFLSRILEEEGIYYYFRQDADTEQLVLSDAPLRHPDLPQFATAKLDPVRGGNRPDDRVTDWRKTQEVRSGEYTLWDHTFELPGSHLEASKNPQPKVQAGSATHRFDTPFGKELEIYDYPGDYAQRFDAVNRGGGDQPGVLGKVFQDNERTATIRMQQEAVPGLVIQGASTCRQFQPGYAFTLEVPDAAGNAVWKADGKYLLTAVQHRATQSIDRSGGLHGFEYHNQFSCIPVDLPFRPVQRTPKPTIHGTQTAVVVGSGVEGEEIFTDKFGRVKVRFYWDRRDPKDHPDSCWIRVAQLWAGKRWGASFWPRIGQEVVVAFDEGDPDKPIIIGSVYNAEQMPPYLGDGLDARHKNDNKVSGIKSNTTPGGKGYNELRFDDTRGKEQVYLHAQRNLDVRVGGSSMTSVGGSVHSTNGGVDSKGNKYGDYRQLVNKDLHLRVKGDSFVMTEGEENHLVTGNAYEWFEADHRTTADNEEFTEAPKIILEAGDTLSLKAQNIILDAFMKVSIKGPGGHIVIDASGVTIVGAPKIFLNSGGSAPTPALVSQGVGSGKMGAPATEPDDPAGADGSVSGSKSNR